MFGVYEMEKLGLGGLKRAGRVTFHFRTTPLDFCTTYEMALGVRNFSHALRKFRIVCEMSSQG